MDDIMGFVNTYLFPHWAFFAWLVVAMLVGQVAKKTLWTKEHATSKKPHWFWWWMRKTMVLHPVIVGMLIGLVWRNPEMADPAWGIPVAMGYFAMAGALSTWAYEFLKGVAKKKGIDLSIPGISESPEEKQESPKK